jgi:hypothetical protein
VLPGLGVFFLFAGMVLFAVGPFVWAREKGYSIAIALLLGLLNWIGGIIVNFLPDERKSPADQENPLYPGQ